MKKILKNGQRVIHTDENGKKHLVRFVIDNDYTCTNCFMGDGKNLAGKCFNRSGSCIIVSDDSPSKLGRFILIKSQKLRP